ncbi:hypothetical protein MHM582_1985 [Microbacterium sp. HM58-2]|nr:hypothetical protein MHM582_1985 [Microbacterium sp. HM58-2]
MLQTIAESMFSGSVPVSVPRNHSISSTGSRGMDAQYEAFTLGACLSKSSAKAAGCVRDLWMISLSVLTLCIV